MVGSASSATITAIHEVEGAGLSNRRSSAASSRSVSNRLAASAASVVASVAWPLPELRRRAESAPEGTRATRVGDPAVELDVAAPIDRDLDQRRCRASPRARSRRGRSTRTWGSP